MSDWLAKQLEALERVLRNPNEKPIKLSYPVIQTITHDFSEEIGHGGFGVVYLGTLSGGKIAVKKLSNSQDLNDKLFTDEVNCLIRAKHENIVRFLGYCADTQGEMMMFNGRFVLVDVRQRILCFEYIPNGNLYDYLKAEPSRDEWHVRYQIIRGICQGLNYLHEELINHLDLKPENVMLDTQMMPKITDFGLSRSFDEGQSRVFTQNIFGTPGYIAPEAIDKGEISFKSDIFSLGIIIIKLLVGRNKYDLENWQTLLDVDDPTAKICIKIGQACLDPDQHKRPTIGKIIHELNELQTVIRNTRNDVTSLKQQEIDFPNTEDKIQYISSDDSSLHSGIAHLEVVDEEPAILPPTSDDSSLQSGTTRVDEEPATASPSSGTRCALRERVQLVIKSSKRDRNKQTVMLELTGGDYTGDRPGLDLVFVVDISDRYLGARIKEVKTAMHFAVQKLGPIDRLCVVSSAATEELCPLRKITEIARQELLELITDGIKCSEWGNNMEGGLLTGLKVLADRKVSAGRAAAIILVCDEQNYQGDASKVSVGDVPVYTFGYGTKREVLSAVAANSLGGTFSDVPDIQMTRGALTLAFAQCLAGLLTVSARDLELKVAPVGDASRIVKTGAGSYQQTQDDDDGTVTVRFGNLYSGEVRKVIVDLDLGLDAVDHGFEITYSYSSSSSSSGRRERFVRPLTIYGDGVSLEEENREVHAEKTRQQVVELIQQGAQRPGDGPSLERMIVEAQKMDMLEDPLLTTELQVLHDLYADGIWSNSAYVSSFLSSHNRQRSTLRSTNTEIMRLFATPCMLLYLDQATDFYHQSTFTAEDYGDYFIGRPIPYRKLQEPETKSGHRRLWPWRKRA